MKNTKTMESRRELGWPTKMPSPNVYYFRNSTIIYLLEKKMFRLTFDDSSVTTNDVLRYIKGLYPDKETFERDEFSFIKKINKDFGEDHGEDGILDELISILEGYDDCEPFTLEEASEIKNAEFKAKVLSIIAA